MAVLFVKNYMVCYLYLFILTHEMLASYPSQYQSTSQCRQYPLSEYLYIHSPSDINKSICNSGDPISLCQSSEMRHMARIVSSNQAFISVAQLCILVNRDVPRVKPI